MKPFARRTHHRRCDVVIGREAHAEVLRGEVSGRKPGSEGESGASFQPAEIRAARFVDLAPSEQFGAHEPPHRKGVGKIGSRVHRRTLQIVVLRHAVDFHAQVGARHAAAETPVGRCEPGALHRDGRPREELHVHPGVGRVASGDGRESEAEPEERRPAAAVVDRVGFRDVQPLLLENQVCEEISQLRGEDADTGSDHDVAHPVPVVELTGDARDRRHGVAPDAVPRAAVAVLLVEHRGGHEGRRRMPRGEGVARRSVGAHHTAGVFERVDPDGHESRRKGVGDQHAAL